jgi:outer membrane cobalamin receptor
LIRTGGNGALFSAPGTPYRSPDTRPAYGLLDVFARYAFRSPGAGLREVAFTGRVMNVLDRHYEERLGIPSPGINFLLGVEAGI